MKKYALTILSIFAIQMAFSQNSKLWKGYFCYREIRDLSESPTTITAASENALFAKNLVSGSVKTTNTIDGLSGQTITAIYHSEIYKKTIIGYQNGLIIVVNETDGSIINVVDIINKALPPNIKKVNHFMEFNGVAYVSCDFGIVQYNLATLQFGDTYFIGNNGNQIVVKGTAIFDNKIYAATANDGIRFANIDNANLNDFNQWTTIAGDGWAGIESFGNVLIAISTTGAIRTVQGTNLTNVASISQAPADFRKYGDYLIATAANHIYIYNTSLIQVKHINSSDIPENGVSFTCATVIDNTVYIGTSVNGLFATDITAAMFTDLTPNGPLRNNIFSITATNTNVWAVFGDYDISYNPFPLDYYGISKLTGSGWLNIPYEDIETAIGKPVASMVRVTVNPNKESDVFISSFNSGLLKLENDVPVMLYDQTNSTLALPNDVRIDGTAFDASGNLWVTNSRSAKGIKTFKSDAQWTPGYDMTALVGNISTLYMGRLTIDKNGTKWMGTRDDGLIGFNEAYGNLFKTIKFGPDAGNLPINEVRVTAVDKRNQLWIGTRKGLTVLSSVDNFVSDGNQQLTTEAIIIIEDNLAQELLYEQYITDIVVDGANNKWIGTADSGVFYVSANGQQTILQFNKDNSPLPSNNVNDIDINGATGEVFFVTDKGMVSYKGNSTEANANLNNVFVFPNPVRPEFQGTVKISGLLDKATVKIADIEGNLVYETIAEGGTIEWDTTAFGKYRVASGVYMIFISAADGAETKVKKVMIIR